MQKREEKYKTLITRNLAEEATTSEKDELNGWLSQSEQNKELYRQYQIIWQTEPVDTSNIKINKAIAWKKINQKIETHGASENEVKGKVISVFRKTRPVLYALSGIAAMLVIMAGIYFLLLPNPSQQLISYEHTEKISTNPFILSDGTAVFFNGEASLSYPSDFSGRERRVSLSGNAFFEIAYVSGSSFVVELDGAQVTALGTSFYIEQNAADNTIDVALLTGTVNIETDEGKSVFLSRGERVIIDAETGIPRKSLIEDYNFMAWKTKKLEFNETPLDKVFKDLQKAYHLNIVWEEELSDQRLTARFTDEKSDDIFTTLELLFDVTIQHQDSVFVMKN